MTACGKCDGSGWVKVVRRDELFGRDRIAWRECACRRIAIAERRWSKSVAERWSRDSMGTFERDRLPDAYDAVQVWLSEPHTWLYIYGPTGTGKTHLAVAAARELLKRRQIVPEIWDVTEFLAEAKPMNAGDEIVKRLQAAQLLVLDDLGTEKPSEWTAEVLYRLINHRYNNRLLTIITSNVMPSDLTPPGYDRIRSRIIGASTIVSAVGTDQRIADAQRRMAV